MPNTNFRLDWYAGLRKIEKYADSMIVVIDRKLFNLRPDAPDRELLKILRDLLSEISAQAEMLRDAMEQPDTDDVDSEELPF